jgi:hypothetical protein
MALTKGPQSASLGVGFAYRSILNLLGIRQGTCKIIYGPLAGDLHQEVNRIGLREWRLQAAVLKYKAEAT